MRGGTKVVGKTSVWGVEDGDVEGGAGRKGDNGRYVPSYSACSASVCLPSSSSLPTLVSRRPLSLLFLSIHSNFVSSTWTSLRDETSTFLHAL